MWCDIHMQIESYDKDFWWDAFSNWELNIWRDYIMFALMAWVRWEFKSSFKPKWIPEDISYGFKNIYYMELSDNAKELVEQWYSVYNETKTMMSNPDAHSWSWLSFKEYKKCINEYKNSNPYKLDVPSVEFLIVLACMEKFEELGIKTRVVFFFDN